MQTKKFQPEGKLIMPEMRSTKFPVLNVDPRVGIFWSTSETEDGLFFLPITEKKKRKECSQFMLYDDQLRTSVFFVTAHKERL